MGYGQVDFLFLFNIEFPASLISFYKLNCNVPTNSDLFGIYQQKNKSL